MDNITHTFIGFSAASFFKAKNQPQAQKITQAFWLTSAIANNVADLDFLYTPFTLNYNTASLNQNRLASLLHHRGYTHTLIFAFIIGLLLFGASRYLIQKKLKTKLVAGNTLILLLLCILGPLLHIGFDSLNSYGVHPFWPFNNNWYELGSVFIIEPWLLALLLGYCYWVSPWLKLKKIILFLALAITLLTAAVPYISLSSFFIFLIFNLWLLGLYLKIKPNLRPWLFSIMLTLLLSTLNAAGYFARTLLELSLPQSLNIVAPFPANPICHQFISYQKQPNAILVRRGYLSLLPKIIGAAECQNQGFYNSTTAGTADFKADKTSPQSPSLFFSQQMNLSYNDLKLAKQSCEFNAFLQFAQTPYWQIDSQQILTFGELRFDRSPKLEFAEFQTGLNSPACPQRLPGWNIRHPELTSDTAL